MDYPITPSASCTIYALHSGDYDFKYVGMTTRSLNNRLYEHVRSAVRRSTDWPVHEWIRANLGKIQIVELESTTGVDRSNVERKWIATLDTFNNGLNQTKGGYGLLGFKWSEESTAKRLASFAGFKHTEETKKRLSESKLGTKASSETRRKMSETRKGRPWPKKAQDFTRLPKSDEHKKKIGDAQRGKPNIGSHNRWHVNRGIVSASCSFCERTEA